MAFSRRPKTVSTGGAVGFLTLDCVCTMGTPRASRTPGTLFSSTVWPSENALASPSSRKHWRENDMARVKGTIKTPMPRMTFFMVLAWSLLADAFMPSAPTSIITRNRPDVNKGSA